jgi:hypothetical protein
MKNIKFLVIPALLATLVGCVNGDDYGTPDLNSLCVTLDANVPVSTITSAATTTATEYPNNVDGDDFIEAYVTSSDEGGNFFKSISMIATNGNVGFSVPVDSYNLYNKFEPGRKVYIKMDGRFYNIQNSSTVIGSSFNGGVGRISGVEYQDIILRSCEKVNEDDIVNNITITQALNNANLNKLIEFDNVQFTDLSLGKKYYDPTLNSIGGATNHTITDIDGNTIIVRISSFATFAAENIPSGSGKIRGVLTKFGSTFQFMVRTINDVKLDQPRIVPIFEETFTSNWDNWTKFSVTGAQVWTLNTTFGNPGSCAIMSGFANSTNNTNEDWLISPSINLSGVTSATLKFDNASRFTGNLLEVYVSTNYNSGAPSTATWTQLTGFTLDTNTGSYIWTNSGGINISSYVGNSNFRVAFRYTSTTSASRTWQVDNVKIQ